MLEVEKRVKEVVAQSIAIVMPRSERSEKKTINVFMMLTWMPDRMWGIDDRVKRKFSSADRQVERAALLNSEFKIVNSELEVPGEFKTWVTL